MRQKVGMAALVLLLVAVWGVGFLRFRGDQASGSDVTAAGAGVSPSVLLSASPSGGASVDPSASGSVNPTSSPSPAPSYVRPVTTAEERRPVDVNPAPVRPRPQPLPPVVTFTMATFNMLGSSHTRPGGHRATLPSGPQRIDGALTILGQHGVTVAGLQEFQPDQRAAFERQARGWQQYPGRSLGPAAGENSVVWRADVWELVTPGTVQIPYFNGRPRPMPYVLLRHRETGVQAYFSTFHNPADTKQFRRQQRFRSTATTREIELFNRLERTGVPQLVTGDMNERASYFCRVTGSTPLLAAAGGRSGGRCAPPAHTQIDWIFGSPAVRFSRYGIDRSPLVRRTTDHPVVYSTVTVDALKFPNAYPPQAAAIP